MKKEIKLAIEITLTVAFMLLSFFVLAKHFSRPETFGVEMEYLEEKRTSVLELAGASTTASLAITALPGDLATPIAEKITDLSGYFLLIVGAVILEKYLLTVAAYAAFRVLIPGGCVLLILYFIGRNENYKKAAVKLLAFSFAIALLIPVSIKVSQLIETTYETATEDSVEAIIQTTEEMTIIETTEETVPAEEQNWWTTIWQEAKDTVSKMTTTVTAVPEKLSELCNRFIEAIAVLIITSCAIPVLVLFGFLWLIKLFLGLDISPSDFRIRGGKKPEFPHRDEE